MVVEEVLGDVTGGAEIVLREERVGGFNLSAVGEHAVGIVADLFGKGRLDALKQRNITSVYIVEFRKKVQCT